MSHSPVPSTGLSCKPGRQGEAEKSGQDHSHRKWLGGNEPAQNGECVPTFNGEEEEETIRDRDLEGEAGEGGSSELGRK